MCRGQSLPATCLSWTQPTAFANLCQMSKEVSLWQMCPGSAAQYLKTCPSNLLVLPSTKPATMVVLRLMAESYQEGQSGTCWPLPEELSQFPHTHQVAGELSKACRHLKYHHLSLCRTSWPRYNRNGPLQSQKQYSRAVPQLAVC